MRPAAQNYALITPFHRFIIGRRRAKGKHLAMFNRRRHSCTMNTPARLIAALIACLAWGGLILNVHLGMTRNPDTTL